MKITNVLAFLLVLSTAFVAEASVVVCGQFTVSHGGVNGFKGFLRSHVDQQLYFVYDVKDLDDIPSQDTQEGFRTCVRADIKKTTSMGHIVFENVTDIWTERNTNEN